MSVLVGVPRFRIGLGINTLHRSELPHKVKHNIPPCRNAGGTGYSRTKQERVYTRIAVDRQTERQQRINQWTRFCSYL